MLSTIENPQKKNALTLAVYNIIWQHAKMVEWNLKVLIVRLDIVPQTW